LCKGVSNRSYGVIVAQSVHVVPELGSAQNQIRCNWRAGGRILESVVSTLKIRSSISPRKSVERTREGSRYTIIPANTLQRMKASVWLEYGCTNRSQCVNSLPLINLQGTFPVITRSLSTVVVGSTRTSQTNLLLGEHCHLPGMQDYCTYHAFEVWLVARPM